MLSLIFALTFTCTANSAELEPYIEYKNVLAFVDSDYRIDTHHLRFGATYGKVYAEVGPTTSDGFTNNTGVSGEVGYKFKFNDSWTLKGKWEGVDRDDVFGHKLETELRYTF